MRNQAITRWLATVVLLALCGCGGSTTSPTGTGTSSQPPAQEAQKAPAPPPPPPIVVPAETVLSVTMDQAVSTKSNAAGDTFEASLAEPVTVEGTTALPKGSKATGTVVQAQAAGRVKGGAVLSLALKSITVHGRKYTIETSTFEQSGKGRGTRTAVGGGGGAAVGAIVGAIAGKGKGAAIGALAGGGAGTAGAALTGERDITIAAETRVTFKLTQSLTVSRE